MAVIENHGTVSRDFRRHFGLECEQNICSFFVEHKGDKKEALHVRIHRAAHYIRTGIWISEKSVCEYAAAHPKQGVSSFFSGKRLARKLVRFEQGMGVLKPSFWTSCKKAWGFVKEYFRNSETVGALLPSSKYLAKEIVSEIPKKPEGAAPRRMLEIGPGTGVFTDKIIKRMNPTDTLDLVDNDSKFCSQLREKYKNIPNVKVFYMSILDYTVAKDKKYDYVVSGLPLNNFSAENVKKIFKKFEELTKGTFSDFDYLFLPTLKRACLEGDALKKFDAILAMKDEFYRKYGHRISKVHRNLFPARVCHHRLTADNGHVQLA